jgi:hypothetical protein
MSGSVLPAEACRRLFADYPLAIETARPNAPRDSMVLMLRDGDDPKFFVLERDHDNGTPSYRLKLWGLPDDADAADAGPGEFLGALTSGVPFPRHGSMFGWQESGAVTALIACYAHHTPQAPKPVWSVLPLAEAPESQWPPFTRESLFGPWFWEYLRAGDVVAVEDLISRTSGAVFWAHTEARLGSGCCVVSRQIKDPSGYVVPRGRFIFHTVLSAKKPLPSVDELLAQPDTTDLTPRFPQSA